jgi:hypothetical protein
MNIKIEFNGLNEALAMLDPQLVRAAAYQAINRTVDGMVTDVSSETRSKYNIKKSDLDKRIKKNKCKNYDNLTGSVEISGDTKDRTYAMPLIMFNAVARKNIQGGGAVKTKKGKDGMMSQRLKRSVAEGVSFKVLKSGGIGFTKKGFLLPGGGGSWQIVQRIGKGKKGIREMRVISLASMIASTRNNVMQRIQERAADRLGKNFQSNLKFFLDQAAQGLFRGGQRRYYQ